jgi:hypothetical protein
MISKTENELFVSLFPAKDLLSSNVDAVEKMFSSVCGRSLK